MDKTAPDFMLTESLVALARRAGEAIMEVYNSADLGVEHKADDSPLTRADIAAHHIIAAGLPDLAALPFISEEASLPPLQDRPCWWRDWLVRPLGRLVLFV